jgi:hypothetical protein
MAITYTAEPVLDAEARLEGFDNLMPFKAYASSGGTAETLRTAIQ